MNDSLDSRQLNALTVLAKTGSVTHTAKELCVTHSAISHSLRNLEGQIGCRLFSKLGKKLMLTEAGEALLVHAERVLTEMRQARVTIAELNRWGSRRLRLGVETIFAADFLTPVLLKFHQEFPRTILQVETCGAGGATALLESCAVDVVLAARPPGHESVEFLPLLADRFHLVVSGAHPLAAKSPVPRQELAGHPCLFLRGCGFERKVMEDLLVQRGLSLNIAGEVESLETVKSFAKHRQLMALLPAWVIAPELRNRWLVSLPVGRKPIEQSWGLIHRHARPLNHAESMLWKFCGQQVSALVSAYDSVE